MWNDRAFNNGQLKSKLWALFFLAPLFKRILFTALLASPFYSPEASFSETKSNSFIGSKKCSTCHQAEFKDWQESHHDWAMKPATPESVLGDFNNTEFIQGRIKARFYEKSGKYFVETDGPDGKTDSFEAEYTFGFYPLQQYLLKLPRGHYQAFTIAWDSRPKSEGGQKWFRLDPDRGLDVNDSLHWTKKFYNWNFSCAECHSTNLKKNYDSKTDSYKTTWSEINVGCEACHGPGEKHSNWAKGDKKGSAVLMPANLMRASSWKFKQGASSAVLAKPLSGHPQTEACGRCHSRRAELSGDYKYGKHLLDTHRASLLTEELYHVDGQIDDEVYVYGSFLQSKMHQAGVVCSNCHNPHSLKLKAEGNALCSQCHDASVFDSPKHHFHKKSSVGSECVACHMPDKVYMGNDPRRDHSFKIPRPDLSDKLKTPNACLDCHGAKGNKWAAKAFNSWYPESKAKTYGELMHEVRLGEPGSLFELVSFIKDLKNPGIQRATAAAELPRFNSMEILDGIAAAGVDRNPFVRLAAAESLDRIPPQAALPIAQKLLADPIFAVRIEAVGAMLPYLNSPYKDKLGEVFENAVEEYKKVQAANGDHANSWVNLGLLEAVSGNLVKAEENYLHALSLDNLLVQAYVNLGDLYRLQKEDLKTVELFATGLKVLPENPEISHALGLTLVRLKKNKEALIYLKTAAVNRPENVRFQYVYAVALHSAGKTVEAKSHLNKALSDHPNDRELRAFSKQLADSP